jgi:hypothetical protein
MSELEDPVTTVIRLIRSNVQIVKDNDSLASILTSAEAYDRELLKQHDGQITVGLENSADQKLELAGRLRRRYMLLRCNAITCDRSIIGADSGKTIRDKITSEINAVIRENRTTPNHTIYDFDGLGYPSGDPHKAYSAGAATELEPSSSLWIELTNDQYEKLWISDNDRFSKSHAVNGEFAIMLFRFKLEPRENCVKKIVLDFEGYGTAPTGNGVTVKVWNHMAGAWQKSQSSAGGGDETVTVTIDADCPDFIDAGGCVWLLARTSNSSNGSTPAVLYCDYVQCTVQVHGISYCDVVSYRYVDVTEVKPYLFKTEFLLKAWLFESLSGAS